MIPVARDLLARFLALSIAVGPAMPLTARGEGSGGASFPGSVEAQIARAEAELGAGAKGGTGTGGPAVGAVPHTYAVANDGSFVASVPIAAPPGAGGLTPALALDYSSTSTSGAAGYRWSVSGLSAVTRCARSIAEHGIVGGIELDAGDVFCLDGRLLRGFKSLGGATEYRFPTDPTVRVLGHGPAPNHTRFEVWHPDGSRVVLGDTATTRLAASNGAGTLQWAESRRQDESGNYWVVDYLNWGGVELLPTAVHYTGNDGAGRDPRAQNRLELEWEVRPDWLPAWVAGAAQGRTHRLAQVRSHADGALVHRWVLRYEGAPFSGRSLLAGVRLEDGSGLGLPELTFTYDTQGNVYPGTIDDSHVTSPPAVAVGPASTYGTTVELEKLVTGAVKIAAGNWVGGALTMAQGFKSFERIVDEGSGTPTDYDGDGNGDLTFGFRGFFGGVQHLDANDPDPEYLYYRIARSTGRNGQQTSSFVVLPLAERIWAPEETPSGQPMGPFRWRYWSLPGDYDGDGRTDLVVARTGRTGGTHYRMMASDGWVNSTAAIANAMDLPGQNAYWPSHPSLSHGAWDENEDRVIRSGDFDGDGRTDLLVLTEDPGAAGDAVGRVFLSQGRTLPAQFSWRGDSPVGRWLPPAPPGCAWTQMVSNACDPDYVRLVYVVADFDGDGRSDLGVRTQHQAGSQSTFSIYRSVPLGVHPQTQIQLEPAGTVVLDSQDDGYQRFFLTDANQDGMTDLVEMYPVPQSGLETMTLWLSTGRGLVRAHHQSLWSWSRQRARGLSYRYALANLTGVGASLLRFEKTTNSTWSVEHWVPGARSLGYSRIHTGAFLTSTWAQDTHDAFLPVDLDGDGRDELAAVRGIPTHDRRLLSMTTNLTVQATGVGEPNATERLLQIDDATGHVASVDYAVSNDPAVQVAPASPSPAVFPDVDVRAGLPVVAELRVQSGLWTSGISQGAPYAGPAGPVVTRFLYGGPRVNRYRGFSGFAARRVEDVNQIGMATTTQYRQDAPYAGLATRSDTTWVSTGAVLRDEGTVWASRSVAVPGATAGNVTFVYPISSERHVYDPDHPGVLLSASQAQYAVDDYGHLTRVDSVVGDGNGTVLTSQQTMSYDNDVSAWHLGLLRSQSSTATNAHGQRQWVTELTYDGAGRVQTMVAEPGDASEQVIVEVKQRDAFGHPVRLTMDPINALAREVNVGYEPTGRFPATVSDPLGHSRAMLFDARFGAVKTVVDANQLVASAQYDGFGRATGTWHPAVGPTHVSTAWADPQAVPGGRYRVEATAAGQPTVASVLDPAGRLLQRELHVAGEPVRVARTRYDGVGRVTAQEQVHFVGDPGHPLRTDYDALGRLARRTVDDGASGRTIHYGYDGPVVAVTDPLGHTSRKRFDGAGNLVEAIDALGSVTRFSYGPDGQVVRVVDPAGNEATVTYDRLGRPVATSDPSSGAEQLRYNALGQVTRTIDAKGQSHGHAYDVAGRLTEVTGPEGRTQLAWDQDRLGRIFEVCGAVPAVLVSGEPTYRPCGNDPGDARTRFFFDGLGRPLRTEKRIAGVDYATEWGYDLLSRVVSVRMPRASSEPVEILAERGVGGWVEALRLRTASGQTTPDLVAGIVSRDAAGHAEQLVLGNGLRATYTRHPALRSLERLEIGTSTSPGSVLDLGYAYDALGRIVQETDRRVTAPSGGPGEGGGPGNEEFLRRQFEYDALGRLVHERVLPPTGGVVQRSFAYDAVGNLLGKDGRSYLYGGTRGGPFAVTARTNPTELYSYDANGNLVMGANQSVLGWTSFDKPTTIVRGSTEMRFSYDGLGVETARQVHAGGGLSSARIFVGESLERVARPGQPQEERFRIGGLVPLLYVRRSDGFDYKSYLLPDVRGSVHTVAADNGQPVAQGRSDAVGEPVASWDQLGQPWNNTLGAESTQGYTGHDMLDEVGLIDMGGRLYDPDLGRVISADPSPGLGSASVLNRYAYVENDPVNHTDPSGYDACPPSCPSFSPEFLDWVYGYSRYVMAPGTSYDDVANIPHYTIPDVPIHVYREGHLAGDQNVLDDWFFVDPSNVPKSLGGGIATAAGQLISSAARPSKFPAFRGLTPKVVTSVGPGGPAVSSRIVTMGDTWVPRAGSEILRMTQPLTEVPWNPGSQIVQLASGERWSVRLGTAVEGAGSFGGRLNGGVVEALSRDAGHLTTFHQQEAFSHRLALYNRGVGPNVAIQAASDAELGQISQWGRWGARAESSFGLQTKSYWNTKIPNHWAARVAPSLGARLGSVALNAGGKLLGTVGFVGLLTGELGANDRPFVGPTAMSPDEMGEMFRRWEQEEEERLASWARGIDPNDHQGGAAQGRTWRRP